MRTQKNEEDDGQRRGAVAPPAGSVSVMHDGLHVVPREEARGAAHHALEPAVVVLLDDVNDRPLLEGQLVLFVARVVINSHH